MPFLLAIQEEARNSNMEKATTTPPGARATDRVVEALVTLSALLDKTINEVKSLDSDFQNRLLQAVHETEASLQSQAAQHVETALAETRAKFEEQFKNQIAAISAEWEAERTRLNGEVTRLSQSAAQWETERARLTGELEHLARVQAATLAEAEKAMAAAKAAASAVKPVGAITNLEGLNQEMQRVEGLIKEISKLIEDPATELSAVIRKNVERAELESYLKGIRFALNGAAKK
jgi:chromosome segregation ATPase